MKDGVRFAVTEEEREASYHLRYKVYVECMNRLSDKANHRKKELRDDYDKFANALIAVKDGELAGTLRLFWGGDTKFPDPMAEAYRLDPFLKRLAPDQVCIIERLMVSEKRRGSSIALRMYQEVMRFVVTHKIEVVLIDCEQHNMASYLKLGFRPFTKTYDYPGIGPVIPMALIVGDYQHLKAVGSPFGMLINEDNLHYCNHSNQLKRIIDFESKIARLSGSNNLLFFDYFQSFSKKSTPKLFQGSRFKMRLSA
jgi:predicted GNAT family N-acyltransferase